MKKVAISIPDPLFETAEEIVRRLGLSRSQFYARAVAALVRENRGQGLRERLDEFYGSEPARLDPILAELQSEALREEW